MIIDDRFTIKCIESRWIYSFYKSRIIRLYPIYFVALFLYLFYDLIQIYTLDKYPPFFSYILNLNLSNFNDLMLFIGILFSNLTLFFINVPASTIHLVIPAAWSLGPELFFYILIPFIYAINYKFIFGLIFLGFLLRAMPYGYHFPFFVGIDSFCMGVLAFRYKTFLQNIFLVKMIYRRIIFVIGVTALVIFSIPEIPLVYSNSNHNYLGNLFYPILFALITPFGFKAFKYSRVDKYLGDLSYPFYLFHMLFIWVYKTLFPNSISYFILILVVFSSIFISCIALYLMNRIVLKLN